MDIWRKAFNNTITGEFFEEVDIETVQLTKQLDFQKDYDYY